MLKEAQTLQNSFQVLSSTYSDFLKQPPSLIQIKTAQDFSYSYECMHGENNKKHLQIFEVPIMLWNINIYVLNIKYIHLCALNRISLHDEYLLDSSPCATCVCKNICLLRRKITFVLRWQQTQMMRWGGNNWQKAFQLWIFTWINSSLA